MVKMYVKLLWNQSVWRLVWSRETNDTYTRVFAMT